MASYESLLLRGYDISAVLCLHDAYYRNDDFLQGYFAERGVGFFDVRAPPNKEGSVEEDAGRLGEWYAAVEKEEGAAVAEHLADKHKRRIEEIESMPRRTLDSVWWPFTQHALVSAKIQSLATLMEDQQARAGHGH